MKKRMLVLPTWVCLVMGAWMSAAIASSPVHPMKGQMPQLPAPTIHQMMKNVAWNELQASEHPARYYRYIQLTISPDGSQTTDEISTAHGRVARLLEVDHRPPSPQQLQKNQQLLKTLPGNVRLQQARFKDQQSDTQRRDNVIEDMPAAFVYTYAGRNEQGQIMLKFRPNPDFQPSSRQSLVLKGMAGEAWIDPKTQRIAKIDGELIQDVKIGWGFLAKLNKGGTFLLEQSQGADGTWHQKLLSVHFDGTVLIFKHIHIHETLVRCCYEQNPDNITIRQAVERLLSPTELPKDWQSRLAAIQKSAGLN